MVAVYLIINLRLSGVETLGIIMTITRFHLNSTYFQFHVVEIEIHYFTFNGISFIINKIN